MQTELIIFDCDGTLVDSEYLNNLAVCELLAEQGLPQFDMDYALHHFVGLRFGQILADISAQTDHVFPDDMAARYIQRARDMIPTHMKTIEGARELVEFTREHFKICVASNGQRENVIYSLEAAGLSEFFAPDHILTGVEVIHAKPAPDLFLLAAQRLGAKPKHALVLEDSVVGVTAGVAAHMTTWGFTGTHHNPEYHEKALKTAGAQETYSTLIHIREHLEHRKGFSAQNKCDS